MKYYLIIVPDSGPTVLKEFDSEHRTEFLREYAAELEKKDSLEIYGFAGEYIGPGVPVSGYRFTIDNSRIMVQPAE